MATARRTAAADAHDYVVLGDLGPQPGTKVRSNIRRYVVRMFLGGIGTHADAHDDEFVANIEDLHDLVVKRIDELAKKPNPKLRVSPMSETDDHMTKTKQHPGHAIPVPGHWLSDERGQYDDSVVPEPA